MCSKGIAKCFLVLFNVLFLLVGALILALGVLFMQDADALLDKIDTIPMVNNVREIINQVKGTVETEAGTSAEKLLTNCSYVLIAIGAFLFVYGFLGCVGACKESKCLLYLYSICVGVILLVEAVAIILLVVFMPEIEDQMKAYLTHSTTPKGGYKGFGFENMTIQIPKDPVSIAWDSIQTTVKCCGVENQTEFFYGGWRLTLDDGREAQVPISCCTDITPEILTEVMKGNFDNLKMDDILSCILTPDDDNSHQTGCYDKLREMIDQYLYFCIGITAGIFLIEILAIVAACSIAKAEKD